MMNMTTAAAAITAVASQPQNFNEVFNVNLPMTFLFVLIIMIITMTGTAATPLSTALQYSALMGSTGVRFNAMPARLAKTSTA